MMTLPETVAATPKEGGNWVPFERYNWHEVHSILFADGSIWDSRNGWRPQNEWYLAQSRELVRRFRPEPIDATGWAEAAFRVPAAWQTDYLDGTRPYEPWLERGYP